ncbi:NUDIX domain-containing protein [Pontibacter sp. JAM-7]|uniref:NUDIX domain-containing protein n=1 Tax=Pontibacter sp. JAM-7 TaxID=3366581 RepID=UPI003AF85165
MAVTHWSPTYGNADFSLERQEPLYEGFFRMLRLYLKHRTFAGGEIHIQRELFYRDDAVCVLLYDACLDRVVLVEQFRVGSLEHPDGPWMLELVAGIVEAGETPQQVAEREAEEEAGAALGELEHIIRFVPSSGATREYIDLYCAAVDSSVLGGDYGLAHEGEDIRVHLFAASDAFDLLHQGKIYNSPAIIALQWLQLNHQRLRQQWGTLDSGESDET